MQYKRIAKGFTTYTLYPHNYNNDRIVEENGENKDYYQSIFEYKDHHYTKYIKSLKNACKFLNLNYDENNKLDLTGKALYKLKQMAKTGDKTAKEILEGLSVSGTQDVETRKIVFDFDSDNDIAAAREDSIETTNRLLKLGFKPNSLQVCFSGNKGFSVEVSIDEYITQPQFEKIIYKLAGDLKTFDSKIKDPQRLFRMPLTKHNSSGLYKIPLTLKQLKDLTVKQILMEAKKLKPEHWDVIDSWKKDNKLPKELKNIETKKEEVKPKEEPVEKIKTDIDFSKKPPWMSEARFMLQEGYFKKGNRNEAFMILATTYKIAGFDATQTYYLLEAVAEKQSFRNNEDRKESQDIKSEIIDVVFSPNWKGGIYSEEENTLLKNLIKMYNLSMYSEKLSKPKFIYDIGSKFKHYVKNLDKNTIKTGIDSLDEKIFLSTGANVGILGAPGSGKTSLALNILNNTSKAGIKSVFVSLDMASNRMYEKMMYKVTGLNREELYDKFKTDNENELIEKIEKEFGNVFFMDKTATSVEDIKEYVKKCEEQCGEKIKLVMIDYFERVHSDSNDDYSGSKKVASQIQDLVSELDICSITLLQPNKMSGDMSKPIKSYSNIKGSSFLAQSFRMILSIYREGFNPEDNKNDKYITINCLKNDLGEPCQIDFKWNGRKGEILELSGMDKHELKSLRDSKKDEDDSVF